MLEVKVIYHPSTGGPSRVIANMTITNDGTGGRDLGHYDIRLSEKSLHVPNGEPVEARLADYPRNIGLSVWMLVHGALAAAIEKASEKWLREVAVSIQALVRADLEERERLGVERYGTPLRAHNGRDGLMDLYEELLDAACYARQLIEERDGEKRKDSA